MKSIQLLLLGILMPMVCAWGQSSQQGENHALRVIIAVNTTHGEGYFVDSEGNRLFNKQFEGVGPFSEGLARVKQNGKWGYINTKGEVAIPCTYREVGDFNGGLARVKQNGKYGTINRKGEVVVPCIYDWITDFSEGLTKIEKGKSWSIINQEGKVIVADCDRSTQWSKVEE